MQLLLAFLGTTATRRAALVGVDAPSVPLLDTERVTCTARRARGFLLVARRLVAQPRARGRTSSSCPTAGTPSCAARRFHVGGHVFALITLTSVLGGWDGFLWGYVVSTCFLLHGTFTINSVAHVIGSRRYATTDTSRNNLLLALIAMGEGWHNNHHHYMNSANQGFFWWRSTPRSTSSS